MRSYYAWSPLAGGFLIFRADGELADLDGATRSAPVYPNWFIDPVSLDQPLVQALQK